MRGRPRCSRPQKWVPWIEFHMTIHLCLDWTSEQKTLAIEVQPDQTVVQKEQFVAEASHSGQGKRQRQICLWGALVYHKLQYNLWFNHCVSFPSGRAELAWRSPSPSASKPRKLPSYLLLLLACPCSLFQTKETNSAGLLQEAGWASSNPLLSLAYPSFKQKKQPKKKIYIYIYNCVKNMNDNIW